MRQPSQTATPFPTTSAIDEYIYRLSQGLDSAGAGRFTLNQLTKSPTLLEAAATYPHRWCYFALQAAVSSGARKIHVGSNGDSVSIQFDIPQVHRDFLNLESFLGESLSQEQGVHHWGQAILWASSLQPQYIQLLCQGEHPGFQASIVGDQVAQKQLPPLPQTTRLSLLVKFGHLSHLRRAISAHLEASLPIDFSFAPISLKLDSREVPLGKARLDPSQGIAVALASGQRPTFLGVAQPRDLGITSYQVLNGLGEEFLEKGPSLLLCGDVGQQPAQWQELRTTWNNLSLFHNGQRECILPLDYVPKIPGTSLVRSQAVAVFRGGRESLAYFVRDGLTLLPIPMKDAAFGWDVYWPAPRQRTDYPGLRPVEDEMLVETRKALLSWLDQLGARPFFKRQR